MNSQHFFHIFVLLSVLALAQCEVLTNWATCEDTDDSKCSVHTVSLTPCPEAADELPCKVKRGTTPTLTFDFTPNFAADTLQQQAYSSTVMDLPMPGFQTDGCQSTTCPIVSGQNYSYSYDLYLAPSFPAAKYNVKWRVWNVNNEEDECCFVFKVKLVR